ncbi:hypothetical protein [Nocardia altamirensis]|uniref:hypothetical protein n=1 Tax=Nocardia altamirensis TaxID=472158 RepID=UPI0008405F88|nr:hypothetical protein [Nocardia altamirensis]
MFTFARLAVAATALTAIAFSGAGTASAADSWIVTYCRGMSPNVVDVPYSGQIIGAQYNSPGVPTFTIHAGGSVWGGYGTEVTLNWTNLATGASGSETQRGSVGFVIGNGSTMYFRPPTGGGPVRTDFTVRNSGLLPQEVNCSGVSEIA